MTTCTFSNGNSVQTVATVTYTGTNDKAVMTGYTVTDGNAKYPASTSNMVFSIMVVNGKLMSAMANLNDSHLTEVFACGVSRGVGGNNFQWQNEDDQYNSSDNCDLSCD